MLKSIHPREMKRQREQLKKDRLKSEKRSVRAYETRDGDSGASINRTALQIDRRQATFIGGNDPQLLLDSLLEAWRQKS